MASLISRRRRNEPYVYFTNKDTENYFRSLIQTS